MEPIKPTLEELTFCMHDPQCIRNVCILAHVDHGKTTVADSLLATNRLVSKRMAGQLRYLDDRPDEQQRGITMKSSAVSLLNLVHDEDSEKNRRLLLNLIDTPGHIDFSSEVGAALRVCDGAIILVDLVEGVCVQTRESIKNAFEENTKMILLLNKFDRLVVELRKNIDDIFQCILRAIEDCNAIVAELYQYEFLDDDVDIENTGLLFSPDTGNVIFASAVDGWGFTTKQIASMFVGLVRNETVDSLNKKMWNFDYYVDSKKEVKTGAIDKKKTNLFVQFCIKTIVHIYETFVIRMEKDKAPAIIQKLSIKNVTRDMTHNDPKVQVKAILQTWKPLAATIFHQCLKEIPPPCKLQRKKINYLLSVNKHCEDSYLNECIEEITPYFQNLSMEPSSPTIAYVSKMFCINKKNLSQNKPKVFIPKPRQYHNTQEKDGSTLQGEETKKPPTKEEESTKEVQPEDNIPDDLAVIALARVFSGTLKVGEKVYAMSSGYLPNRIQLAENPEDFVESNGYVHKVVIKELYLLFGRELMFIDAIPAGNFCGIGGLEAHVLRTATLSSILNVVPICDRLITQPVVRHAVEPVNPKDLPILRNGLKLLMQSDSCVEVMMQQTGELVLLTAGDVHLGKCIEDLTTKFAKVDVHVSRPMVSIRETVINTDVKNGDTLETSYFILTVAAIALPEPMVNLIRGNYDLLKTLEQHHFTLIDIAKLCKATQQSSVIEKTFKNPALNKALLHVRKQLNGMQTAGKIWSISDSKDCINLLINGTGDYNRSIFLELDYYDKRALFDRCLIKAFNILCKAGPMCEEPLANCAFVVRDFQLVRDVNPEEVTPQVTASIESAVRTTFRKAFEKNGQRLMEPIYTTDIQVNTSILGKVYTVVGKRHGKILDSVGMDEQEKVYLVKAEIPVVESEGFANEIRKATSGQANPTLRFSHYEIIDGEPFFEPVEDEDDENVHVNVEAAIRANKLRKDIRKRKGLPVDDEVVIHAEKQRTLNKKK